MTKSTVVLVHGAWHNARHWSGFVKALADQDCHGIALDLLGHGSRVEDPLQVDGMNAATVATRVSPLAGIGLDTFAEDLLQSLQALQGGQPSVVLAHSMGGVVLTRAAEIAPELISRLIYLTAFVPLSRSASEYFAMPEFQTGYGQDLFVADPAVVGAVRINPRGDAAYMTSLWETYYGDVARDDFSAFAAELTYDLPLSFVTTLIQPTPARWGRIPRTFIRCSEDRALAPAVQDIMIADANRLTPDNPFQVINIRSSHSAFASMPRVLSQVIAYEALRDPSCTDPA
jgi:pimeloyl-ACP methyl ester carboxylesterase